MPIQKKKVKKDKDKSEAKPAGANIKQEPEELKPLAEYIDDRLELIRQVFSCVKPKEINYLLPDFLQGKSNDIIKERCLDELLGISTKRLRSIINNTKCPTDTESDSENSDLEKIEEHISLDEISSDSDADGKRSGKSGGARDKRNKTNVENAKPADERNGGGDAKSEKEMTVLELLELQARARAIRSQLALEPVTKIEIDSEHEDEDARQADVDTDEETNRVTRKRASPKTVATGSVENGKQLKTENSTTEPQPRRVRLKRNFRVRQAGDDSDADEVSSNATDKLPTPAASEPEPCSEPKPAETVEQVAATTGSVEVQKESDEPKAPEKVTDEAEPDPNPAPVVVEKSPEVVIDGDTTATKEVSSTSTPVPGTSPVPVADSTSIPVPVEENAAVEDQSKQPTARDADRESSPEVIPVEASPETLCISSDSEEERLAKQRAAIFVDNIEELDRQAQETVTEPPEKPADEDDEPEEGEISEEEEEPPAPTVEESVAPESAPETQSSKDADGTVENPSDELIAADGKNVGEDIATSGNPETQPAPEETPAVAEVQLLSSGSDESDSESSGDSGSGSSGSSDSEADENEEKRQKSAEAAQKLDPTHDDADIVEIHDSGDEKLLMDDKPSEPENPEEKSWNSRWLKSNRVAKVMAASRLGNKVREKLKKKKQIQQAEQQQQQQQQPQPDTEGTDSTKQNPATESQQGESAVAEQPSNVEVGSVEHYRELVAQQETKD
ncbi:clumping factor B [Anopheles darlingi]|uniref:clumping factor B n=1 Tax=Anopheles darlingi TaxID=43151 RepID=UPI002100461B|nr:clumping factor B [Anopheles darlingi]